ncbi:flavin reductase family protein [Streptomyces silvisoli]|uniref:Flavin reductase family protein n=1 Tax=Streptomyces silvisoli TaxID=3034235 RepID=A0ABT5ZL00_9ACTN|nr:flavin reductase family protein [Streptomyces silvisoli]MDF3290507.1 flavin reductase family protein [Streptomyces silvisoli]
MNTLISETVSTPAEVFAEAMSSLVSGVAAVTARTASGDPCGLLVSSICSYSAAPPSVLVAVDRSARSYDALLRAPEFGVHLLGADQQELARVFASRSDDKFGGRRWDWDGAVPRLTGSLAYLRCATSRIVEHGDHAVLIGEVASCRMAPGEPLVYFRRALDWRLDVG